MKKIVLLSLIFALNLMTYAQGGWRPMEMEVKVELNSLQDAMELSELNFNGDIYAANGYAILYLIPGELEQLKSSGYRYEILKSDLNGYYRDFWNNRDAYHSYEEIIQWMNTLTFAYSDICKKFDLGLSVEGRILSALKISDNVHTDEDEAEIMFDGGIHGDEIGGAENLIRFAQYLCEEYGTNPDITDLVDNREIWLYVMVNPDGRVNMVRYNSNGIDLNRDWGYMWNSEGGSPGYYSQIETKALRDCMYDNQFVVHTSYHSGTEFISYPWSYRPDACPDQAHIHHLAEIYATTSGYTNIPYMQGYQGMYPINGSSKDAYYAVMGSIGWTIEISNNKQPPATQIQYYYEINQPAMLATIEHAGYGIKGLVSDAGTGEPVAAMIFVNDFYPSYTDPVVGDYHKYLLPGTYEVKAAANGYEAVTQTVVVTALSVTTQNFALQPADHHYAYRVPACAIPDNNYDDEGTTYAALWEPDDVRYSIGRSGWIILDMGKSILDGPGEEIRIIEGDNDPEGYTCFAGNSIDGPWTSLGNGTGSDNFNFSGAGLVEARYIRIVDDGNGSASGDNAGFDLDAVEVLEQPEVIYLMADAWVNDPLGNNNGRIDPGESCDLMISLRNHGGLTAEDVSTSIQYDSVHVNFIRTDTLAGNLAHGVETVLSFPLTCSMLTPPEEIIMMVLNVSANSGVYTQSYPMHFTVGAILEDWETGGFEKFDWSTSGARPWVMNFLDPYEGVYCSKSGNIDDNQLSVLEISLEVIGHDDLSFFRKVSSESGGDFLRFYIDGVKTDEWSGNLPWERVSYNITPGQHTFRWTFEKNATISQGYDGGYIDYIVFPSSNLTGEMKAIANALPHEFCGEGTSQLGAYAIGGSGTYSYSWTPPESLSNPGIQFPVANPSATTLYEVTVNDGTSIYSANIQVSAHPIPETPVVTQQGDSLVSSATSGNQWYNSSGMIEGATGQVFYPDTEDYYHVIVTSEYGCISDPSVPLYFIFTGLDEGLTTSQWLIYPNPVRDILCIQPLQKPADHVSIILADMTGRMIHRQVLNKEDRILVYVEDLPQGIYILKVTGPENHLLHLQKIIR